MRARELFKEAQVRLRVLVCCAVVAGCGAPPSEEPSPLRLMPDGAVEVVDSGVPESNKPDSGQLPDSGLSKTEDSGVIGLEQPDAGSDTDAGAPQPDAGQPYFDAGVPDAGQPRVDAGQPVYDAGQPAQDAGTPCVPGTLGCGCAYTNGTWGCNAGTVVGNPVVCDTQTLKCTNCGYVGGPCCEGPSGRTCNGSSSACLHHVAQVYQCHANFSCTEYGTGSVTKPCFEGGCCGGLSCAGTCY